jgi:hypothetical protein
MQSLRFIVVGPIAGLFHVCYEIPGTKTYASYESMSNLRLAQQRADQLNAIEESEQEAK